MFADDVFMWANVQINIHVRYTFNHVLTYNKYNHDYS